MPQEMGMESQAFGCINHFLGTENSQAHDFNAQLQAADSGLRAKARIPPMAKQPSAVLPAVAACKPSCRQVG